MLLTALITSQKKMPEKVKRQEERVPVGGGGHRSVRGRSLRRGLW